jgi:hypothetical protein
MIGKKFKCGTFKAALDMSDICKDNDSKRGVGKCLGNFLIPCFGADCV